jgi:hypothetical protein
MGNVTVTTAGSVEPVRGAPGRVKVLGDGAREYLGVVRDKSMGRRA